MAAKSMKFQVLDSTTSKPVVQDPKSQWVANLKSTRLETVSLLVQATIVQAIKQFPKTQRPLQWGLSTAVQKSKTPNQDQVHTVSVATWNILVLRWGTQKGTLYQTRINIQGLVNTVIRGPSVQVPNMVLATNINPVKLWISAPAQDNTISVI